MSVMDDVTDKVVVWARGWDWNVFEDNGVSKVIWMRGMVLLDSQVRNYSILCLFQSVESDVEHSLVYKT